tara:strand:+ start:794 stop:973 length:180 start_codon:yes stop_codon:yes gene_type:complete
LPAPFGPRRPTASPLFNCKETLLTTFLLLYVLEIELILNSWLEIFFSDLSKAWDIESFL